MELNNIAKNTKLLTKDAEEATTATAPSDSEGTLSASSPEGSQEVSESSSRPSTSSRRRVGSVKICAGGAIDRIEFRYQDGSKWSLGGPGGDKGIPPLVLAEDEYLEEVRHESLPQWWYVGSSIEFRTNKGKLFRHVAGWGSGEDEDMVSFRAAPGKCITRLQLHDGVLKGIVEEDCHVPEGTELEMFMTYWTHPEGEMSESREVKCPKGHLMRKDWSRTGHICDECSQRGTAARCGGGCDYDLCEMCYKHHLEGWASAVQRRGFASRDGAMNFASRHGAPSAGPLILGPLRLEMEDHPWLDGWRELREACTAWTQRFRSLYRQALGTDRNSGREGPFLPTTTPTRTAESLLPAGLVVDVRRGTRIRAWGPPDRLAMCEKAAVDAGEFNAGAWSKQSSSFKGFSAWVRRTVPLAYRVLSLLDWRRNVWSSVTTLAEHFATEDVAQTLRALHKESARNLERLKFHVRMSSEEHSAAFPMAAEADATSNVCASAACEVVVNPPSWSGDLEQIADGSVQEPPAWAAGLVPMVPSCPAVSTPDLHKDGLEAPWAYPKPLDAALAAQAPQEREASAPLDEGQGSSASGTGQEMRNYQVGSDSLPGKKRCMDDWKNQDSSVIYPLGPTKVLVGVFDGHGEQGREVSSSVAKLFALFAEDLAKLTEAAPMDQVLPRQFANLFSLAQDGLRRGDLAEWSGTTGTLAMIDTEAGCVVCAYVGDSRMIICHNQRVLFATSDHDVDDEAERRVTAAGGEVRRMWVSGIDARRVFLRGSDIPGLSMSRALGDLQASAVGVLNEPSIHTCVQIPGGSAVILASDGLWEKVTTQEVAAITTAALKLKGDDQGAAVAAKALVSEARSRWIQEGGDVDDITAVVVHLSQETMPELASGA